MELLELGIPAPTPLGATRSQIILPARWAGRGKATATHFRAGWPRGLNVAARRRSSRLSQASCKLPAGPSGTHPLRTCLRRIRAPEHCHCAVTTHRHVTGFVMHFELE